MTDEELEALDFDGEGYRAVIRSGAWRVAFINYGPGFDEANIVKVERHLLTDEVFVLLCGRATLILGLEADRVPMEPGRAYNVKKGAWHHVVVSRDAKLLIVENVETSPENSEYHYFK